MYRAAWLIFCLGELAANCRLAFWPSSSRLFVPERLHPALAHARRDCDPALGARAGALPSAILLSMASCIGSVSRGTFPVRIAVRAVFTSVRKTPRASPYAIPQRATGVRRGFSTMAACIEHSSVSNFSDVRLKHAKFGARGERAALGRFGAAGGWEDGRGRARPGGRGVARRAPIARDGTGRGAGNRAVVSFPRGDLVRGRWEGEERKGWGNGQRGARFVFQDGAEKTTFHVRFMHPCVLFCSLCGRSIAFLAISLFVADFNVDFETRTLSGSVEWLAEAQTEAPDALVLDSRGLTISGVEVSTGAKGSFVPVESSFGPDRGALGRALRVPLPSPPSKGEAVRARISFSTSPDASALQWLSPEQTAGGKRPYLFSQCQAIHARSMVPCQDAPGVKFTYEATVAVPKDLVALMSAVKVEDDDDDDASAEARKGASDDDAGLARHQFVQSVPIPSYLFALAVGDLARRELSPRCAVYSEPSVVESAANEFVDTPKFLAAAEDIAGPYVWGRYDLLVLPPSFPYGGMENPCLTFVTPTLLAGDRSLVNVVAHEIAHSWTGNLVTNASWEHFWLNEGWTVWLERKIDGRMHGEQVRSRRAGGGSVGCQRKGKKRRRGGRRGGVDGRGGRGVIGSCSGRAPYARESSSVRRDDEERRAIRGRTKAPAPSEATGRGTK